MGSEMCIRDRTYTVIWICTREPCLLCYNSKPTRLTLQNGPIQSGDGSGSSGHTSDIITVEARGRETEAPSITVIFADDAQPGPHRGAMEENEEEEGQEEAEGRPQGRQGGALLGQ